MIYIADISSIGVQHEQFNVSFINLVQTTSASESISVFTEKTHGEILKQNTRVLSFEEIDVYSKRGGLKEFVRAYYQYKSLLRLLKKAEQHQVQRVFILLIHPFAHFLFKQFSSSKVQVAIVMHGELESVKFNKHFVNKIWGWFLKRALSIRPEKTQYIILGESIYQNLLKTLPIFRSQHSIVLDHPYPFDPTITKPSKKDPIVLSSLGVATTAKNSQLLFGVANEAERLGYKSLIFYICGRVYKNMAPYLNQSVKYKSNFESLSRSELNGIMEQSDFAVFYYDDKNYSLCSSGAFWDAVNAEIPMLYVQNDYFGYYANKVGPIGIAFETARELSDYILKMGREGLDVQEYEQFLTNLRRLKNEVMSTKNLVLQLQKLPLFSTAIAPH